MKNYSTLKGAKGNTVEYYLLRALVLFDLSPEWAFKWKGSNLFTIATGFAFPSTPCLSPSFYSPTAKHYPTQENNS
jgi:hypothetical protein